MKISNHTNKGPLVLVLPALFLFSSACGGGSTAAPQCTVDPALIAEARDCSADDECPCGSSCRYGQCQAECLSDEDCSAGTCDSLGQCSQDGNDVAPLELNAKDGLLVSSKAISFTQPGLARSLSISSQAVSDQRIRASVGEGFQVSCDDGGSWADECFLDVPTGQAVAVRVRPQEGVADAAGSLSIYPVRGEPMRVALGIGASGVSLPTWQPLSQGAKFRGAIKMLSMGAEEAPDVLSAKELPAIPVTAALYPGASRQVLVIREALGFLVPDGILVGVRDATGLSIPAYLYLGDGETRLPETEVVAQPIVRDLRAQPNLLAFTLELRFSGAGPHQATLKALVELHRSGNAPGGDPPEVPPSYMSLFPGGRDRVPVGWEAKATAICGGACEPDDLPWFLCDDDLVRETTPDTYSLTGPPLSLSGDPTCDESDRALAPDYVLTLDAVSAGGSTERLALLQACRHDLTSLNQEPAGDDSDLDPRSCFHPLRFYGALASLSRDILDGTPDSSELRTAHRLLQQLIEAASYTASNLIWAGRFNRALGGDCGDVDCPTLGDAAEQVGLPLAAVETLLRPRYAEMADRVVSSMDATGLQDNPSLGYSLLRFVSTEAELMEGVLEQAHLEGDRAPVDGYAARAHRRLLLLRATAARWLALAPAGAITESEHESIQAQIAFLDERVQRIAGRLVAMRQGKNPLGIDDDDVPLYLDRDVDSPEARAFALTNYLLDPDGQNWIGQAIGRAAEALQSVREAWAAEQSLTSDAITRAADQNQFREDAARTYGRQILALCPVEDLTDVELVQRLADGSLSLDPNTCFLDQADQECMAFAVPGPLTSHKVFSDVCMASVLRAQSATAGLPGAPEANVFLDSVRPILNGDDQSVQVSASEAPADLWTVTVGDRSYGFSSQDLASLNLGADTMVSGKALEGFDGFSPRDGDSPSTTADMDGYGVFLAAQQLCTAWADRATGGTPPVQPTAPQALDRADCYRGGLGEAALDARAAQTDLEAAESRLQEHYDHYRIAVASCTIQVQANDAMAQETDAYEASVADLKKKIGKEKMASGILDIVGTAAMTFVKAGGGIKGGVVALIGVASGSLKMAAADLQKDVDAQTAKHDAYMAAIQDEADLRICMNEASQEMVGLKTATLEIHRAVQNLGAAVLRFTNLKVQLTSLLSSAVTSQSDTHGAKPYGGTLWLDQALTLYEARMRLARRVTYLAAQAVAYERQDCDADGYCQRILLADTPDALEAVRNDMLTSTANRQIGNGTVGDAFAVLSLKDDILQLSDRITVPEGENTGLALDRFRRLLTSPRFAVYERGVYKGQLIHFQIVPPSQSASGYSAAGLFSQNYCAERLWSVNIGIVGEAGVSGSSTLAHVEVLKSNEFYSRWCRPEAACDDSPIQATSINPAVNLFADPYNQDTDFLRVPRGEAAAWSRVVLSNVRTDVIRTDMERAEYEQGAQSGFAGRGLYGAYAIFFPADAIRVSCPDDPNCGSSAGNALDLTMVDDIIIRLDYVAGVRP